MSSTYGVPDHESAQSPDDLSIARRPLNFVGGESATPAGGKTADRALEIKASDMPTNRTQPRE